MNDKVTVTVKKEGFERTMEGDCVFVLCREPSDDQTKKQSWNLSSIRAGTAGEDNVSLLDAVVGVHVLMGTILSRAPKGSREYLMCKKWLELDMATQRDNARPREPGADINWANSVRM